MAKQFLWALVIVAVLGGAYWWWQDSQAPMDGENTEVMEDEMMDDTDSGEGMENEGEASAPLSASITFNGSAFTPSTVTIKKGGTVTWTNSSDVSMWVATAQHPTHTVYAGTNLEEHCPDESGEAFDQCKGGDTYSFTFDKVGTWRYHDHLNAGAFGSVVVVE